MQMMLGYIICRPTGKDRRGVAEKSYGMAGIIIVERSMGKCKENSSQEN